MIEQKRNYRLYSPTNSWDMNYHLVDDSLGIDYLIDTGDIQENVEAVEEYGGMVWEEFKSLNFIDEMIELSWKQEKASVEIDLAYAFSQLIPGC